MIPNDLIQYTIIPLLPIKALLTCRLVNKKVKEIAEKSILDKCVLGANDWLKFNITLTDAPLLPSSVKEYLLGGKAMNRLVILIPRGISEAKLGELFKGIFPNNNDGFKYLHPDIKKSLEFRACVNKSRWIGISKTTGEKLTREEFSMKLLPLNRFPKRVEVIAAALLWFHKTNERLLANNGNDANRTWCQEIIYDGQSYETAVGSFKPDGLMLCSHFYFIDKLGLMPVMDL